ncbi:MAG: Cof-type HAD-IIB family hydrolase [Lachnospiraceae bacterium]|nr:Cof-type HAD-IIB family hydrolase [Lachnospiraceae bacterium]
MIRMIGLDLDGTVLTGDKRLTERNREALEEAAQSGVFVVPVTGRPLAGIPEQVLELPFIRYIITSNGAVTTDRAGGRPIRERCMARETAEKTLMAAEGEGIIREFFTGGYGYHDYSTRRLLWKRFERTPVLSYLEKSRIPVEDLYEELGGSDTIENLSIMCSTREEKERILARVRNISGIRIIYPWPTDLEITSSDADKGEALLSLAELLGCRREEVMAMGDGNNDLGLMKAAGLSVAMGNSAPEVIEAADYVTTDNEHDGVALAVRRYILGRGEY